MFWTALVVHPLHEAYKQHAAENQANVIRFREQDAREQQRRLAATGLQPDANKKEGIGRDQQEKLAA